MVRMRVGRRPWVRAKIRLRATPVVRAIVGTILFGSAGVIWWVAAINVMTHVSERLAEPLWAVSVVAPSAAWAAALYAATSAFARNRRTIAALTAAAYVAAGTVYALLRNGGYLDGSVLEALLWPTLFLWQDACRLGVWPCPAG